MGAAHGSLIVTKSLVFGLISAHLSKNIKLALDSCPKLVYLLLAQCKFLSAYLF
jgi:hypothetical protein